MKYKATREWHQNTSKAGRVDVLSESIDMEGFMIRLVNEWEPDYSQSEIDERVEEWGTLHADGESVIDFIDYSYRLSPLSK